MSGLEALMAGRTDPFGTLLPPMAKPPAAGPNPDRASSGNILTGGLAGGGADGPLPHTPGLGGPRPVTHDPDVDGAPRARSAGARLGAAHPGSASTLSRLWVRSQPIGFESTATGFVAERYRPHLRYRAASQQPGFAVSGFVAGFAPSETFGDNAECHWTLHTAGSVVGG